MGRLKITDKTRQKGLKIAQKNNLNVVYVNDKGEFFSTENLAALSVKGDKEKYTKIEVSEEPTTHKDSSNMDVIVEIAAAKDVEQVQEILNTEKARPEIRQEIIDACYKRMDELKKEDE